MARHAQYTLSMKIELNIPDETIRDYVDRANVFWGIPIEWDRDQMTLTLVEEDNLEDLGDEDEDEEGNIRVSDDYVVVNERWKCLKKDVIKIHEHYWGGALEKMVVGAPGAFQALMTDDGDMYTGDLLIQFAAFGEEKYA